MAPQQTIDAVEPAGLQLVELVELPPYHYAAIVPACPLQGRTIRCDKRHMSKPPILTNKLATAAAVVAPRARLRVARLQKGRADVDLPAICIVEPDADIVRRARSAGQVHPFAQWPCYHTQLDTLTLGEQVAGIVGCAVGAPF